MTVEAVMHAIERDVPFFDQSGGGVTFSGGEPLMQRAFLLELLRACRAHDIHTVVDTCGYAAWEALDSVRGLTDLFLYDLKVMDDEKHLYYTGVSNAPVLRNLRNLCASGAPVLVRMPLVPGINDDELNLRQTGVFLAGLGGGLQGIELIGYHAIAAAKYTALGRPSLLPPDQAQPATQALQAAADLISSYGVSVIIAHPLKEN